MKHESTFDVEVLLQGPKQLAKFNDILNFLVESFFTSIIIKMGEGYFVMNRNKKNKLIIIYKYISVTWPIICITTRRTAL